VASFDSQNFSKVNWPWPFKAQVSYSVRANVFSSSVHLQNNADTTMPAGLGWHPYFNRYISKQNESVNLCMDVKGAYPDSNNNRIPSGPPQPLLNHQDFSKEKPLSPHNFLDTCFYGYNGKGYISWPDSGVKIHYTCSPQCSHLVIYNPSNKPFFAVEPITNANNGVNLYSQGESHSGIVALQPGKCLDVSFVMNFEL